VKITHTIFGIMLATATAGAWAQNYPNKSVRVLVGFSAGGATDNVARFIAPSLGEGLGQNLLVENRAGASSIIAGELVAKAAPDGYTLFMVTQTLINAMILNEKTFPDLAKDFAAVSLVATTPLVLVVNPSLPVKSVSQLIALAKARPNQINYGSGGIGASPHMSGELLAKMAGIKIIHVPYKGEAPALVDLLGGHLPVMFSNLTAAIPMVQAGKLRAIGVTSKEPAPAVPGVPPVAETLPGFEVLGWFGLVAPLATPRDVIARVNSEVNKALARADVKQKFAAQGLTPSGDTPEHYGAFIKSESAKWSKLIKDAGISIK